LNDRETAMPERAYLGDSVYAEIDPYGQIELTVDNGMGPTERIVLDDATYEALTRFVQTHKKT